MSGATANTPAVNGGYNLTDAVKIPERFVLSLRNDQLPIDVMTALIFENIGGQELLSLSRTDILNGQSVKYSPIKNLSQVNYKYNSGNIIEMNDTIEKNFKNFSIRLEDFLPDCGSGYDIINEQKMPNCESIYVDPESKDLVIDLVNMQKGYLVEVQFLAKGTALNDTIY